MPNLGLEEQDAGGSGAPAESKGRAALNGRGDIILAAVGVQHSQRQLYSKKSDYIEYL
jgi:hypothetical protein